MTFQGYHTTASIKGDSVPDLIEGFVNAVAADPWKFIPEASTLTLREGNVDTRIDMISGDDIFIAVLPKAKDMPVHTYDGTSPMHVMQIFYRATPYSMTNGDVAATANPALYTVTGSLERANSQLSFQPDGTGITTSLADQQVEDQRDTLQGIVDRLRFALE